MDHLLSRPGVVSATNKDSITISRCSAFYEMMKFNIGSWMIALVLGGLAYVVVLQSLGWKIDAIPETTDEWVQVALFSGPTILLSIFAFVVPIILNPYILGWPFYRRNKKPKEKKEPVKKVKSKKVILGRACST
jgi:O-antigen/teichoic acid export membrane protein